MDGRFVDLEAASYWLVLALHLVSMGNQSIGLNNHDVVPGTCVELNLDSSTAKVMIVKAVITKKWDSMN